MADKADNRTLPEAVASSKAYPLDQVHIRSTVSMLLGLYAKYKVLI